MTTYETLDAAFSAEIGHVLAAGHPVAPRGMGCLEVEGRVIRLANPRARLISAAARRWSLPYAVGEFCWHLSGSDSLEQISYYSRRWRELVDGDPHVHGSCYGRKLFHSVAGRPNQWEAIRNLLRVDPDSRRAVLSIFTPDDVVDAAGSPDVPCCSTLQFLLRDGRLNLIATMRSNDLFIGFGYDIFFFTMLQELMACELGVDVGWYQHSAGSLHLYDRDLPAARRVPMSSPADIVMPMLDGPGELHRVLRYEQLIREGPAPKADMVIEVSPYWEPLVTALVFHRLRREGDQTGMNELLAQGRVAWSRPLLALLS